MRHWLAYRTAFALLTLCVLITGSGLFAGENEKRPRRQIDTAERLFPAGKLPDRITRNMPGDPATELSISWRMNSSVEYGFVEYLEATDSLNFTSRISLKDAEIKAVYFEGHTDHYFWTLIDGLKPNTEYQLRVGGPAHRSEWFHVQTAPKVFEPWHFLHFGGVQHFIMEYGPRIYREAATRFPDAQFMSHSGDLVQARGGDDDWGEFFYAGHGIFNRFPLLPSAGNSDHWEVSTENQDIRVLYPQWNGIFHCPPNHAPYLENLAYYVDYPGVRVISLYSGMEAWREDRPIFLSDSLEMTETIFHLQMQWLDEILEASPKKWHIIQMHHPVLSARKNRSYPRQEAYLQPLLEKHSADLVLQSHEHLFARGKAPGSESPVYLTTLSGSRTKALNEDSEWVEKSILSKQLYQVIFVEEDYLHIQTYSLSGAIVDEFQIVKQPKFND